MRQSTKVGAEKEARVKGGCRRLPQALLKTPELRGSRRSARRSCMVHPRVERRREEEGEATCNFGPGIGSITTR